MFTEKIKMMLVKRNMSAVQLAEMLETTPTNLYNKFKRDNFSEKEVMQIANALNFTFKPSFIDNTSNDIIYWVVNLFCYCLSLSLSILYHKVHLISIGNIYKYGTPYLCIFTTLYIVVILLFVDI